MASSEEKNKSFSRWIIKRLPSIIFIILLVLLYISNIFSTQQLHNKILKKQRDISKLTVTHNTVSSELVKYTKESNIINEINRRNIAIQEIVKPPVVIYSEK
ncbi:MAG: FtsL-like putative cell division protein [Rikenellaceae bacterium]